MGIKKEINGTYTVSVCKRHPISRAPLSRRRTGIMTEREARRTYDALLIDINTKFKRLVVPTWSNYLDQYIRLIDRENELTKGTVYKRDKVLKKHTAEAWGDKCLDEITPQDIRDLLDVRFAENADSHKKFFIKGVRLVFQHAVDAGLIVRNPTPTLKFKVNLKIKAVLNEEQIMTLLRKAQELEWPWFPHYAVALFTGLRSGELYALTWEQVNLDKRQILVNQSWTSKDGFKSTKSGSDRITVIPKPLLPVLQELKVTSGGEGFVLPRLSKWDQGEQARDLRLFLQSIGLPQIRFHDLRASWATMLLGKGVAPSKVMAMGGWSDMKTMMIYMRKAGIDIKDAASCLDDMRIHGVEPAKILPFS